MDPTEEVFSAEELSQTDPRDLQYLLQSRAYTQFFEPLLLGLIQQRYRQLADPSLERHRKHPDDFLRGAIRTAEAILNAPTAILAMQERAARQEADTRAEEHQYDSAAEGGQYGRASAPISPTDPIR